MAFVDEMDRKIGTQPILKIELYGAAVLTLPSDTLYPAGTLLPVSGDKWTDITKYYESGADFRQEKERGIDQISSADVTYTFANYDGYFTKLKINSIFFGQYLLHHAKIRCSVGFRFDGTEEYETQSELLITEIKNDQANSKCYIRCQDRIYDLISQRVNVYSSDSVPKAAIGNTGNGVMTRVETKPFSTITEDFTVTLTSATAFSVNGSISGDVGTGTVGEEFTASGNQCKFTLNAGSIAFDSQDIFTFSTYRYPEWDDKNPVKIIWSILTGYDWDTDTQDGWYERTLKFDHTKSTSNTDLDYDSFVDTVDKVTFFTLSSYIPYNSPAKQTIEEIISMFLGATFIGPQGKITINFFKPVWGTTEKREFSDIKKITQIDYKEDINLLINSGIGNYKATKNWAWSDDARTNLDVLDGHYSRSESNSIDNYGVIKNFTYDRYWYSANGAHLSWAIDRLIYRHALCPRQISIKTGLDALKTKLGDVVLLTDSNANISRKACEVVGISKNFSSPPYEIILDLDDLNTTEGKYVFSGSSANENDGISPQVDNWDSANATERDFCYLSTADAQVDPRHYLW